ncbi:T9SS type B sorting domain-containing protein [Winogradskyella sp.]|uniref:T9SS type B sorting domain-containing protein n=1 Tax=Winogradskyella sp. TaxID=1883156 RepID=UPI003BABE112
MKKLFLPILIFIVANCYSQDVIMQTGTVSQCGGTFYDSGGQAGSYGDNEDFILTICPENAAAGEKIQLVFTEFSTQISVDVMTIFDGDSTAAPPFGTFSGANSPGVVEASAGNTSGCITIQFVSNAAINTAGWAADINCALPCQTIVANIDSTIPALQPGNVVIADVDEVITFNGSGTFSVDGTGATYFWDFGDGNTATGQSVTHSYNPGGLYSITLTITDTNPAGCQSTNDIDLTAQIGASTPGNPFVDAGDDIIIDCDETCATLNAEFLDIGETNTYSITQIPFVPPFPFQGLTNSVNTNIDDAWNDPEALPFDFCFFDVIRTDFQVGSNGVIRFDVDAGDAGNAYQLNAGDDLPNNSNPTLGEANVFTPCHDINPAVNTTNEIRWEIIGAVPNRVLAVSYFEVPMFQCTTLEATHMAVLYETTNVIDIYIRDKPTCTTFNGGRAVVGIQNDPGTEAFVPPGRNVSDSPWTTSEEAWRFTPSGPSIIDFAWLDDTGAVIGTTPTLDVCPLTDAPTTYTARVTYTNCNGDTVVVTDDVTVTRDVPFTADLGTDIDACEGDPDIILDADIASATATYVWLLDGTPIANETNPTLTVPSPNSGTYTVEITDQSCSLSDDIVITFNAVPLVNPITQYQSCDDTTIDGFTEFDLSTKLVEILGGQTDVNVSFHDNQTDADNDANPLPNLYTNTENPEIIFVRLENANNESCYVVTNFELLVSSGFTVDTPNDLFLCDDLSEDGVENFDFTQQTIDILAPFTDVSLTYHLTQADAEAAAAALPNPYQNANNPQTIFVRLEDDTNPLCFVTTSFEIEVLGLPIINPITPLEVCDDDITDGFTTFQLSLRTNEILAGQADVNVSYHETFVGAETDSAEIFDGYVNTTPNNQTIFIRLENTVNGCYNVTTMDLVVLENPVANMPTDFEVCDDNGDGISEFALDTKTPEVEVGQIGVLVTYHPTEADAIAGTGVLPTLYNNTVGGGELIYVRIENIATGCFDTTTLQLVVHPQPSTVATDDLRACDYDNPGDESEEFDLSIKDTELIDGQANVTVTYYPSGADADAQTNAITAPYTNIINPQEITAVLTNTVTGCTSRILFDLMVDPLPSLVVPTALEVCDDGIPDGQTAIDLSLKNFEISGGNPAYSVTYYPSQADADAATNPLPIPYTNMSNPETIFVRVEDTGTGCYATTLLDLLVEQAPVANVPDALRYCDPDNDGFGPFDLTAADGQITGGVAGLTVTYHETLANADSGANPIDTTLPYNNISAWTQTLHARVESSTIATDCATVVELVLIVEPTPQLVSPSPLEECDDVSADGFAVFDLTASEDELLNGLDPLQYTVSYHPSEADAEAGTAGIANPNAYVNTTEDTQTLWVRVVDGNTVEGCYKVTSLDLIVHPLPVLLQPDPLEECDVETPDDEREPFTLEDAGPGILGGQTGITLSYYETEADAESGTSPISSPYVNTMNAQTVYVRGENEITGCYETVTLTLRVLPVPSPEPDPTPIEVCDDDNDGFAEFDLELRTVEITNGEPDVVITYHDTQESADAGENALASPYTNIVANSQMIYVRSENLLTGCYSLTQGTLELIVVPSPQVPTSLEDLVVCDDDGDGISQFDLGERDGDILGTQDPAQVVLTHHVSAADAQTGDAPIGNPGNYTNTTNPQTLYIRLYDPATGCFDTGELELRVDLPPVPVVPAPLELCDDLGESPGDELTSFDLTVKDVEITGGNASWSVSYYETDADAQLQENAIGDPTDYTNTSVGGLPANPQTLYAVVTDTDTGCVAYTTLTIRVLPNPTPTPSDQLPDLVLCDDINTGDGQEVFDLTENEVLLLNGEAGVTPSYHETAEDADTGDNAIADPTQYTNTDIPEQAIYVRVTNDVTGCYTVVDFAVRVDPLPEVVAVTDFIQCELNTDGFAGFDLTVKDAEVLNGQDPGVFEVSYHESLADAESGMNALVSPYTNIMNPQEIYVTITNNVTGCSISTQRFDLRVDEAAQANPDMVEIVYELCDDAMETDGDPTDDSVQFDLSTRDAEVLDGQDPVGYLVTYYATEEDADLGVNPLPNLYENIVNPQVIYARVDNEIGGSICFAVAPLTLQVNPLPVVVFEESYILCVNTNGTEVLDPLVLDTGLSAVDYSFEWTLDGTVLAGETGPTLSPAQGGIYGVTVTDITTSTQTSCTNMAITEVIESEPPVLTAGVTTQAFSENHVIEAVATGPGDYEYSLDGGPWQSGGTFADVSAGEHEVTARDRNGCGLAVVSVFVLDYPRYFTPNGDGNHETWNIAGIGSSAKIYIFDRYGKLLKQLSPTGPGWDGTFNGQLMPTSDYWFLLEYDEPLTGQRRELKAHFTLKR